MGLFGHGHVSRSELEETTRRLEGELNRIGSAVRTLELEQERLHTEVRKWMRRAVEAERRTIERGSEHPGGGAPGDPVTITPPPTDGSHPRRLSWRMERRRQLQLRRSDPLAEVNGSEGTERGVHP